MITYKSRQESNNRGIDLLKELSDNDLIIYKTKIIEGDFGQLHELKMVFDIRMNMKTIEILDNYDKGLKI